MSAERAMANHNRRMFCERGVAVASHLRAMAEDVERAVSFTPTGGADEHAMAAADVIRTVMWGTANLNLDLLARLASDADVAVNNLTWNTKIAEGEV